MSDVREYTRHRLRLTRANTHATDCACPFPVHGRRTSGPRPCKGAACPTPTGKPQRATARVRHAWLHSGADEHDAPCGLRVAQATAWGAIYRIESAKGARCGVSKELGATCLVSTKPAPAPALVQPSPIRTTVVWSSSCLLHPRPHSSRKVHTVTMVEPRGLRTARAWSVHTTMTPVPRRMVVARAGGDTFTIQIPMRPYLYLCSF